MLKWKKPPPQDYLKYWRVVRYFVKAKYGISQSSLEIMLFLYSERYFSKDKFDEFDELISWNKNRFEELRQGGWIDVFRKDKGSRRTVYEISYKGRKMVGLVYKKLNGEEFSENPSINPMFKRDVPYMHKVYRNYIKGMNKFIQQQRHQTPE